MILNDATLLSKNIDGVECSTMREFVSKLVKANDLSMKVYVNSKLVCAGPACLNIDNNWIIASTNALVSYTNTVIAESIVVKIMQGNVELFESVTPCSVIIPAKDAVATFYVCLASSTPYNELSKKVPHSVFRSRHIAKLTPVDFDKITTSLNPSGDIVIDDPDDDITVEPTIVQVTINTFSIAGPVEEGGEITSAIYKYDTSSNTWQPNKWDSTFECIATGTNLIRVGVYNSMKIVDVTPADGVENIEVSEADEDSGTMNIKNETGAVAIYQISFVPTASTSLIVNVQNAQEEP